VRGKQPAECQYEAGLLSRSGEVIYGPVRLWSAPCQNWHPSTRLIYSDDKRRAACITWANGGSAWLRAYSRSRLELLGAQTDHRPQGLAFRMSRWGTTE